MIFPSLHSATEIAAIEDALHSAGHALVGHLTQRRHHHLDEREVVVLGEAVATVVVAIALSIDAALFTGSNELDMPVSEHLNYLIGENRCLLATDPHLIDAYLDDEAWMTATEDYILSNHWDALHALAIAYLLDPNRTDDEVAELLDITRVSEWATAPGVSPIAPR